MHAASLMYTCLRSSRVSVENSGYAPDRFTDSTMCPIDVNWPWSCGGASGVGSLRHGRGPPASFGAVALHSTKHASVSTCTRGRGSMARNGAASSLSRSHVRRPERKRVGRWRLVRTEVGGRGARG